MHKTSHLLFASVLVAGCAAAPEALRPTDATGRARGGEPAAAYDVRDDSRLLARVIVWSQGVYSDGTATYVHVAAEVQNVGSEAVALDTTALEAQAFDERGAPFPAARLVSVEPGGAEPEPIEAATARDFDFYFALPANVPPQAVGSLRLRWGLSQGERRYLQFTDFTTDVPRVEGYVRAYVPIYGFYDPFFLHPRVFVIRHHVPVRRVVVPSRPRRHY
jgi:hypothetical protein